MKALIINYTLEKSQASERTSIHRALHSHTDFSNNGSYEYKRRGILDLIPNIRLGKGVFIILDKDKKRVLSILKKHNATIKFVPANINKSVLH
jgi:hypothetical protein